MTEDVCNLNKKCADPRNDSLLQCTGLNCTNVIHELCGQRIRTTFHNNAKTDEEKGIVFLEADVICSKKCFNAIVKTKLSTLKCSKNSVSLYSLECKHLSTKSFRNSKRFL